MCGACWLRWLLTRTTSAARPAPRFSFGVVNDESMTLLQQEALEDKLDLVLHVGDMAYNLDTDDGRVGDTWMNNVMPIATRIPYMTGLGNHEDAYNFTVRAAPERTRG